MPLDQAQSGSGLSYAGATGVEPQCGIPPGLESMSWLGSISHPNRTDVLFGHDTPAIAGGLVEVE